MSKPDNDVRESLTPDEALDLLREPTRRRVVRTLRESEPATLGELAEATVACADGVAPTEVTDDRRERTEAMLHQCHLPRLADADVVEYDSAKGRVELTGVAEDLEPYFEVIERYEE